MSKGVAIDLGLSEAYNDLFSTQEERDNARRSYVTDLPAAEISDFPDHPFKVRMDEEMERLVDSVKERGTGTTIGVSGWIGGQMCLHTIWKVIGYWVARANHIKVRCPYE